MLTPYQIKKLIKRYSKVFNTNDHRELEYIGTKTHEELELAIGQLQYAIDNIDIVVDHNDLENKGTLTHSELENAISSKVAKAISFVEGNLKKFDAEGNDVDTGIIGEFIEVYDISIALQNELNNEAVWLDNEEPILTAVTFSEGVKGQRHYSYNYFYECVDSNKWVRSNRVGGGSSIEIVQNLDGNEEDKVPSVFVVKTLFEYILQAFSDLEQEFTNFTQSITNTLDVPNPEERLPTVAAVKEGLANIAEGELTDAIITRDQDGNVDSFTTNKTIYYNRDNDGNIVSWQDDEHVWALTRDAEGNLSGWTVTDVSGGAELA